MCSKMHRKGPAHTRCLSQAGALDMEHVDWIVCNSGADIWLNFRDGQAEGKAGWHADESWEEHINFRCWPSALSPSRSPSNAQTYGSPSSSRLLCAWSRWSVHRPASLTRPRQGCSAVEWQQRA